MRMPTSSDLNTPIRFERRVRAGGIMGAGKGGYETVTTVYAEVQDMLPRSGQMEDGEINIALNPCRIRTRFRTDLDASMRIAIGALDQPDEPRPAGRRYLSIVAGPAELGRRQGLQFTAQEVSTTGNEA